MTAETIILTLPRSVIPLILDELQCTLHTWHATEEYKTTGYTHDDLIMDCQNEQQAKLIVSLYEMIIHQIEQQL